VVWGHQQAYNGLPTQITVTRATTLASTTFRTLMAITAKLDPETQQMDAYIAILTRRSSSKRKLKVIVRTSEVADLYEDDRRSIIMDLTYLENWTAPASEMEIA